MHRVRRSFRVLPLVTVMCVFASLLFAQLAFAQTPESTMGLVDLEAKLNASPSHSVPGCFKTVMQGSTISTITCTILGVTGDADPMDTLILFKASDAVVDDIGGIAEGMSGSPIYVQDDDADWKVIGAVSYGDAFTIGSTGLATPIETMIDVRNTYAPHVAPLTRPVAVDGRVIDRVIVAPDPQDFAGAEKSGALVAKPLNSVFIGGLREGSRPYKALAADLAAKGLTLTARATPGSGTSSLDTTLVPGASVGAFVSRGDMWLGGIGTVTYVDGKDVLAFGHPMFWSGPTGLFMTNAFVDGVWPSARTPYKLARPAALKGTITQDRYAGILGDSSQAPAETTITSHAVDLNTGKTASTSVELARDVAEAGIMDDADYYEITEPNLCWAAGCTAAEHLQDVSYYAGSADVTTTVVFGDADSTYTAVLPNTLDSGDLTYDVGLDAALAARSISGLPASAGQMHVKSMNVDVAMSTKRRGVEMATLDVPGGLKHGANRVVISLMVTATAEPVSAETTLTIPDDVMLGGEIYASGSIRSSRGSVPATTAAGLVTALNALPSDSVIELSYYEPNKASSDSYDGSSYAYVSSADASVTTPWVIVGDLTIDMPRLSAKASPTVINQASSATLKGAFGVDEDASVPDTVGVFATDATHPTERLLGTAKVSWRSGAYSYTFKTPALTETTKLRVHSDAFAVSDSYEGGLYGDMSEGYGMVSGDAYAVVQVRAGVSVAASSRSVAAGKSITLSAQVAPVDTAGRSVVFEWAATSGKKWHTIANKKLVAGGDASKASASWKVMKGKHRVRARFVGGPTNAASSSSAITVTGK